MKIREAISRGVHVIYTRNNTRIVHLDHGQTWDAVCPPKIKNGKKVWRWLCVGITNDVQPINGIEDIEKYKMLYSDHDYIIPERELNLLIAINGGIDVYQTDYWNTGWMYY